MATSGTAPQAFVWGPGGQKLTPEQVAREREVASALMASGIDYSPVSHWAQGLARVAQAGVGALKDWRANQAEEAGLAAARETYGPQIAALLGIDAPSNPVAEALTAADAVNAAAAPSAAPTGGDFLASLIQSESGGNWAAQNDAVGSGGHVGHFGRLQFGQARLEDAKRAGVLPAEVTPQQFMASPELQQKVEAWHFSGIDQNLAPYVGATVSGVQMTPEALRAVAHLGGVDGARRFVESGGQYNPADRNGTSLLDYAARHGGTGRPTRVAQSNTSDVAALLGMVSDPWARQLYGPVLDTAISQQLKQRDPMYQLQMQAAQQGLTKGELEIQALLNPAAPTPEYGFTLAPDGTLIRTDKTSGTFDPMGQFGTPDDGLTDTQRNLSWRAEQAGLVPGTPEYAEFMRSGGQSTGMALSVGPDGTVQFAQGGAGMKALTEGQSKDTVYATRATGALPDVDRLEQSLLSFGEYAAGNIPLGLGNYLRSEDYQVANNAGKEFLASILRKDTGAAVTPSEETLYGDIFLPRPGDKPATLARKRQARALAVEAIKAGMPPQAIQNMATALEAAGINAPADTADPAADTSSNQSQPRVVTQQEYQSLPSGAPFIAADDPSRTVRIKP